MGVEGRSRRLAAWPRASFGLMAAAAAALALLPVVTHAQQARTESVLDRPRPEFAPIGLELDEVLYHVGLVDEQTVANKSSPLASFVVHPTAEVAMSYDSNIFRTETDKRGDAIFDFRPSVSIASDWANHEAHFAVGGDVGRHFVYPGEDFVNYRTSLGGRIDVTEALYVSGEAGYSEAQTQRGTPDNPGGANVPPQTADVLNAHGEVRYMADAVLLSARIARDEITNSGGDPLTTPDGDRVETTYAVRTGYEFSPGTTVFVEPRYNTRNYARRVDAGGLLQGSNGYNIQAGLTWDVTGVTFIEFGAGYLSQRFDEPGFETVSGVSLDGKLIWNPTGLLTVTAGLTRRIDETTLVGASGVLVSEGKIGVDYEYLDNLIVSLRAGYSDQSFRGFRRDDTVIDGSLAFDYRIGSRWYARLAYSMARRNSTLAGAGFSDQVMTLAVGEHL